MAKIKTKFVCQSCGYETPRYMGKCPECGSWGSFTEETVENEVRTTAKQDMFFAEESKVYQINQIEADDRIRLKTGFDEFDRVLGGGAVSGSVILLAGDPGIGKSTLVLQTAKTVAETGRKVLYVCAEESATQVKLRAERLNVNSENIFVYSQTDIDSIKKEIKNTKPDMAV